MDGQTAEPGTAAVVAGSGRGNGSGNGNGRRGGHFRGRGRGGRGKANVNPTATANTTSGDPATAESSSTTAPQTPQASNSNRGNHGRRGGRRGGGQHSQQMMVNGQRAFGGQLTTAQPPSEGSLAGDAPEFVPGRPVTQRARPPQVSRQSQPQARRMSKSQAPDIATRTHEDIANGQYECVICTNEVLPNSKIWTCKTCWSVLHLSCVKRWSKNEVSTHQQRAVENGELPTPRQWRCPGCNLPKQDLPNNYSCWCEKEVDPKSIGGLPPHSCGQSCGKTRVGKCPHPCELICHAGPCPPCGHMGPKLSCFCGKEAGARRCVDTNYDNGWSCGQVCRDWLPCGTHECQRGCHEGLCGSCEVLVDSKCFCGKVEKEIPCCEREDGHDSHRDDVDWVGSFNCGAECTRPFDCGNSEHFCESTCHPQDSTPAHCPFSPDVVTHCPCGKTSMDTLLSQPRKSCLDKIPHCKKKCQKTLPCAHLCQQSCHEGECMPCLEKVPIACRCGRTTSDSVCHQGAEEPPCCMRICRSTLNCGRHECGERCCPGEKRASERQASKRKHRALDSARPAEENIEAEHICVKVCGRALKCGNHLCADLCHKGPCRSCLEAVFNDISCACGKTTLQPPQPCGTQPPECRFDCTRQRNCGHPQVKHQCHLDGESCPKCPFLVEKPCICGKKTLKNQPCWFTEVRCGLPCGRKLKCGIHTCQSLCHRPGACEDAGKQCIQDCGRKKTVCEHDCEDKCHAPYPCKELVPCQAKTFITCSCQHQKQPVKCLASKTSPGNTGKLLDCNDECLRLQRNAKLAAALNIDPSTHTDDHIPYSTTTLNLYLEYPKFTQQHEREFRVFANTATEKRLRFKPMQAPQRAFIHALADDYGLDSESQDPEPHRHVSIFKTPRFVSAPMKTIGQCVKLRPAPTSAEAASSGSKQPTQVTEPWNAILLTEPLFGVTIDELYTDLKPDFQSKDLDFEILFLPSGDCILQVNGTLNWNTKIEVALMALKPTISTKILALRLAKGVTLCAVDTDGTILRREDDYSTMGIGGWSQVAKGAGRTVRVVDEALGKKSSFTVLGKLKERKDGDGESVKEKEKLAEKKKKVVVEDAVEDWEKEVEGWGD